MANSRKAKERHREHNNEKQKALLAWELTQYGIGAHNSKKKFAANVIESYELSASLKTVQNWISEFDRD